jgi:hypothetical protein
MYLTHLLVSMLKWDPRHRITIRGALLHQYFGLGTSDYEQVHNYMLWL